jgi:hypothetical protein
MTDFAARLALAAGLAVAVWAVLTYGGEPVIRSVLL